MTFYTITLIVHIIGAILLSFYMVNVLFKIFLLRLTNFKDYSNKLNIFTFFQVFSGLSLWLQYKSNAMVFCQKIMLYTLVIFAFQIFLAYTANTKKIKLSFSVPILGLISGILISFVPFLFI